MQKEKKPLYFVLMLVNALLMAISLVGCLYLVFSKDIETMKKIISIISAISIIIAAIYLFKGTSKKASIYFKLFIGLFSISELLLIGDASNESLFLYLNSICFASTLLLAVAKDLGKFKSTILCLIVVGIRLGDAVKNIISFINEASPVAVISVAGLALSLILAMSVYAKYADKDSREAK